MICLPPLKIQASFISFLLLFLLICHTSIAQETAPDSTELAKIAEKIATLKDILVAIPSLKEEIKQKRREQSKRSITEEDKAKIEAEIEQYNHQLENLNKDLVVISSGIDPSTFFEKAVDPEMDWEQEIKEIFFPVVSEIKSATTRPREIERLRAEAAANEEHLQQVEQAISKLNELSVYSDSALVDQHLQEQTAFWAKQQEELKTKSDAIRLHLEEKISQSQSFSEIMASIFSSFFKSHGKNLLLAILALFGTFFSLRLLHKALREKVQAKRSKNWQFLLRIADFFYYLFTIIASFTFFMMVLYSASDWLLLGLSIVMLLGLIWVGKNAVPLFVEQAKLLLDLGPVREGERVIYNGVPWLVDSLNLYTYLTNPDLDNSRIILPIKDLIGLRSRPFGEEEPWFPSRRGDWVILADGHFGQVVSQSPDTVVVEVERGSWKSYSIESYLENSPQNLTRNYFTISEIIGIHYKYRDRVNTEICPQLKDYMQEQLQKEPYGKWVHRIRVELEKMNDSSLDLEFFVKFRGGAAPEYIELSGRIQQIALSGLNHLDIEIPYPHLTIEKT